LAGILKASGSQTAAIAIACGALLWANYEGWLPAFDLWVVQLLTVAMVICGSLALASLASKLPIQIENWHASFKEHRELRHSIETLNADETAFLKSQVEQNQTTTQLHPFNVVGIPKFVQQAAMYQRLQNKRIVTVSAADPEGKIQTITIERAAWKQLKKKFETKARARLDVASPSDSKT
jgi:hypothetical protein